MRQRKIRRNYLPNYRRLQFSTVMYMSNSNILKVTKLVKKKLARGIWTKDSDVVCILLGLDLSNYMNGNLENEEDKNDKQ